jgi:RNA polymerase sigma-70 factor, ECF subfamily
VDAPTAFRQQLLGLIPRLRRYARAMVRRADAADDIVQATIERALAHWHQFDQRGDMLIWLFSIQHRTTMDRFRHRSGGDVDDASSPAPESQAPESGFDVVAGVDVFKALHALPVEQREPLLLVTLESLTYAQCGQVLSCPPAQVASRVAEGRMGLRRLQGGQGLDASLPSPALRRVV